MSVVSHPGNGKITVPDLLERKTRAAGLYSKPDKITCLTAYDYPTARLLDQAGVDVILVGDSVGMVALGYESTLPVTLEDMLHHTRAARRGTKRALLVADMPFGSYHTDTAESLRNAVRFVKEAGAEAVKVEGGERRLELIARLTEAEIPVMSHVGLTPQSLNALGGYRVQGKTPDAAEHLFHPGAGLYAPAEIRATVRAAGRNHCRRGAPVLPGRALRRISFRCGVLPRAARGEGRARSAGQYGRRLVKTEEARSSSSADCRGALPTMPVNNIFCSMLHRRRSS